MTDNYLQLKLQPNSQPGSVIQNPSRALPTVAKKAYVLHSNLGGILILCKNGTESIYKDSER